MGNGQQKQTIEETEEEINNLNSKQIGGSRVYARTSNGQYRTGVIEQITDDTLKIKCDHGSRLTYTKADSKAIVTDKPPPKSAVTIGTEVIAWWPNDVKYYTGHVDEISDGRYHILYDNKKEEWVDIHRVRIFSAASSE